MFETSAWATVLMYTLQDSNLAMHTGGWSFDLLGPSWWLTWTLLAGTLISNLMYMEEGIAGSNENREFLPFHGNRVGIAMAASFAYFAMGPLVTVPPIFLSHDRVAFETIFLPGIESIRGISLSTNFILEAWFGFSMLTYTLLFERKISDIQQKIFLLLIFFFSGAYDTFALTPFSNASSQGIAEYNLGFLHNYPVREILLVVWVAHFVKVIARVNHEQTAITGATDAIEVEVLRQEDNGEI